MSTLDFFEMEIKCPFCGELIQVNMTSEDGYEGELCGGHAICEYCTSEIHDEDLP